MQTIYIDRNIAYQTALLFQPSWSDRNYLVFLIGPFPVPVLFEVLLGNLPVHFVREQEPRREERSHGAVEDSYGRFIPGEIVTAFEFFKKIS